MNIGFVNPALLWGLLAAAIPIAIHLFFRRRPRPTPFPAIDFVLRARRETERRLRLKRILLFAARTLLLAALALALARPRLESPAAIAQVPQGPRATAIVLDASGSMRYRLGGRTLFERARADALGALASLSPEEPATAVVCAGGEPQAEAPSFDRAAVRHVLERADAESGFADVTACVAAAARALSESNAQASMGKRIVVATDLAASAWRLDVAPPSVDTPEGKVRPEVMVLDAARGSALPNAAILAADAEPDPAAGPRGYRIAVQLANYGHEPLADTSLSLVVGTGKDARVAIRAFADLPPGGATTRKTLSHGFAQGGPMALQLALPQDALAEDDTRPLVLIVPREIRALVVDGAPSPVRYRDEAYFVESALASAASPVRPTVVDADALAREDLSNYDVVFLLNVRSPGAKTPDLVRFVEQGGGLFVSLGDQIEPEEYAKELGGLLPAALHVVKTAAEGRPARFGEVDLSHPALSVFGGEAREGLLGVRTFRYVLTKPAGRGPAPRVLATFDDGAPALLEARRGKGRVLLFTSSADRDWTDWPIRTSYLPALQRFAGWLGGGLDDRREAPGKVGEPRTIRLDEGEQLAALLGPDGRERRRPELERAGLKEEGGAVRFTPREPGLWQVKVSAGGLERIEPRLAFAVAFDPRESDTRRIAPEELTAWLGGAAHAKVEGDTQAGSMGRQVPLWSILLVLGIALFFLEGLLIS